MAARRLTPKCPPQSAHPKVLHRSREQRHGHGRRVQQAVLQQVEVAVHRRGPECAAAAVQAEEAGQVLPLVAPLQGTDLRGGGRGGEKGRGAMTCEQGVGSERTSANGEAQAAAGGITKFSHSVQDECC